MSGSEKEASISTEPLAARWRGCRKVPRARARRRPSEQPGGWERGRGVGVGGSWALRGVKLDNSGRTVRCRERERPEVGCPRLPSNVPTNVTAISQTSILSQSGGRRSKTEVPAGLVPLGSEGTRLQANLPVCWPSWELPAGGGHPSNSSLHRHMVFLPCGSVSRPLSYKDPSHIGLRSTLPQWKLS